MKIEKDVPLPTLRQEYLHYPFEQMDVGDSFFVADHDGTMTHRLQTQVSYRKTNGDAKRYTTRRVEHGVRVWRVS